MSNGDPLTDPPEACAATVVLLRDGELGVEALLGERPTHGSFAGAWVFPGGRIDAADTASDGIESEAAARRAAVRETREEIGLVLDADELVAVSIWHPPVGIARRFRTTFFATRVPDGEIATGIELLNLEWIRPAEALDRHAERRLRLMPPTWVTLFGLSNAVSVDQALRELRGRPTTEFTSKLTPDERVLLWPPDAEYDPPSSDQPADEPRRDPHPRHRLIMRELPWVYVREH